MREFCSADTVNCGTSSTPTVRLGDGMDNVAELLISVRSKGIEIWVADGRLHYRIPKDRVAHEELEALRKSKDKIIALLQMSVRTDLLQPRPVHRPRSDIAPLAFSQIAHWNMYNLGTRRVIRGVAQAVQIQGIIDSHLLQDSVNRIVRRHDALRTQIVRAGEIPSQKIVEHAGCSVRVEDLSKMAGHLRDDWARHVIGNVILELIDVSSDPLTVILLLRRSREDHILFTTMEHSVSDGVSAGIFVNELLTAYEQEALGCEESLPVESIQFSEYAAWQRSVEPVLYEQRGLYWYTRLCGCDRVSFPQSVPEAEWESSGWSRLPIYIEKELKEMLSTWCRLHKTTLVMSVLTAFSTLIFKWCGVRDTVIPFQYDGRSSTLLSGTIGYVAYPLYLRVELAPEDTFVDLLSKLTHEFYSAHQHADLSYLESRNPRAGFTRNALFNWIPQRMPDDRSTYSRRGDNHLMVSRFAFEHPGLKTLDRDTEPMIGLSDLGDCIIGGINFSRRSQSIKSMERFALNLKAILRLLIEDPKRNINAVALF